MEDNGTLKGFSWRGGSKRETTGIWMWSKPYIIKLASGEEVWYFSFHFMFRVYMHYCTQAAILLIDTQGMFDHQSTINDNTSIFALSLILSSVQVCLQVSILICA